MEFEAAQVIELLRRRSKEKTERGRQALDLLTWMDTLKTKGEEEDAKKQEKGWVRTRAESLFSRLKKGAGDESKKKKAPMTVKAAATIQDSRVADMAAHEPIRVEVIVERLGAGKVRAILQSNLCLSDHREMAAVICPPVSAQIEEASG